MEKLLEEVKYKCTEFTAGKEDLSSKLNEIFSGSNDVYFQSEATDKALIGPFNSNFTLNDRVTSLRVFNQTAEIYAVKDGDTFLVRFIEECETGEKAWAKDVGYILRASPSNLENYNFLFYREYYREDEDGLLDLICGRFYDLEKGK